MLIFVESPESIDTESIVKSIMNKWSDCIFYDIYKHQTDTEDPNRSILDKLSLIIDMADSYPDKVFVVCNGLIYAIAKATADDDLRIIKCIDDIIASKKIHDTKTIFVSKKINSDELDSDRLRQFIDELRLYNSCITKYENIINDSVINNTLHILVLEDNDIKTQARIDSILNMPG